MKNYKQQFKGKKITVMGLGLLGRGIGYTKFLAECGADLIVTDLKNKDQLATSLKALSKFKNIKYILGEHRLEDFRDRDMIIKAAGVPFDSIYIKEAKKNKIPIEMDVSLFIKSAPKITVVGVTGTRGKSMTTTLIYEILKKNTSFIKIKDGQGKNFKDINVYVGGNLRGIATLPLLKKVKEGDILVCELDSWQLQGFGEDKISPDISVFTSFMPDHMNYYKNSMEKYFNDKANIFKYQKKNDTLIIRSVMNKLINKKEVKGKFIIADIQDVIDWEFSVPSVPQRENLACAVEVAKIFNIPLNEIKKTVKDFKGLEGRLQYMKTYKGIKIYNDNNATTPEATIVAIEALSILHTGYGESFGSRTSKTSKSIVKSDFIISEEKKNIILICGGADKKLDLRKLVKSINSNCKAVIFLPGTGTERLLSSKQKVVGSKVNSLKEAARESLKLANKGDVVLFSPAFASFGMFNNEYERNDLFVKIIKGLK